jgi:predicted Rdx family selenoprotein
MVLKPGPRADELLGALAERLDRPSLRPTEQGVLHIRVDSDSAAGAWDFVDAGLNELEPDWPDYLRLDARPDR